MTKDPLADRTARAERAATGENAARVREQDVGDWMDHQEEFFSDAEELSGYQETLDDLSWDRVNEFGDRISKGSHARAFPMIGADLTIAELVERDRLGWAMRDWEMETEGIGAWIRCVVNAVFEDAYGPQAIAEQVEERANRIHYEIFGPDSLLTEIRHSSDQCERSLCSFVSHALKHWFGDSWQIDGVPESVRERAIERATQSGDPDGESNYGFFRYLVLLDYDKILKHDATWQRLKPILVRTGSEKPSKKSFKLIQDWSRKIRNPSAHAERSDMLTLDHVEYLRELRTRLLKWTVLLDMDIKKAQAAASKEPLELEGQDETDGP